MKTRLLSACPTAKIERHEAYVCVCNGSRGHRMQMAESSTQRGNTHAYARDLRPNKETCRLELHKWLGHSRLLPGLVERAILVRGRHSDDKRSEVIYERSNAVFIVVAVRGRGRRRCVVRNYGGDSNKRSMCACACRAKSSIAGNVFKRFGFRPTPTSCSSPSFSSPRSPRVPMPGNKTMPSSETLFLGPGGDP